MDLTQLVWTPVHSQASWRGLPSAPRVARAALVGQGWLVATDVGNGWSVTFVPDAEASNPEGEALEGSFHAAKVGWSQATLTDRRAGVSETKSSESPHSTAKRAAGRPAPDASVRLRGQSTKRK
jgi:hypothetical protein